MKVITYYRVSTMEQSKSGLGMDAQRETVSRYLDTLNGVKIVGEYVDILSGGRNDRPALTKALERCELTNATLVIAKLDRLSRNIAFIDTLQDSQVKFVCVDAPEANDTMISLLALMAKYERKAISQRTRDALQAAKARGVRLGNPRLAEVANTDTTNARRAHVSDAAERNAKIAKIIAEIEREADEPLSLQQIADELNGAGCTTGRKKPFTKTAVMRVKRMTAEQDAA